MKDWLDFHIYYMNEMKYLKRSLTEIVERMSDKNTFKTMIQRNMSDHKLPKFVWLDKEEISDVTEYIVNLGRSDQKAQVEFYNTYSQKLKSKEEKAKKNGILYTEASVKLAFLLGLLIVILLI